VLEAMPGIESEYTDLQSTYFITYQSLSEFRLAGAQ
jgi:hypothetical protein